MKIDTIKYIDSFSYKTSHLQVNAAFLKMFSMIFQRIQYRGSKECLKNIKHLILIDSNIELSQKCYPTINGNGKFHLIYRYVRSLVINIIEILFSHRDQLLFFNFNNVFSLSAINFLNKFFKRNIIILCHGELELLRPSIKKEGILQRLLTVATRSFFNKKTKISKDILFIVLGDSILNNLQNYLEENQLEQFISIDHPYIFSESSLRRKNKDNLLRIGTIGSLNEMKGGSRLVRLANLINTDEELSRKVKISVVGQVFISRQDLINANVEITDNITGEIPIKEFSEKAENLDYMLFLYDKNSYQLTASGALFDSIKYGKPFISIHNNYFSYIKGKYMIPGYIVESVEDIPLILKNINMDGNVSYKSIKEKLSPEFLVVELSYKLHRAGKL